MFNCLSESSESDQGKYRGVIGEEVDSSDSMGFHLVIMESVFLFPRTRGSDFTIWYIHIRGMGSEVWISHNLSHGSWGASQ